MENIVGQGDELALSAATGPTHLENIKRTINK